MQAYAPLHQDLLPELQSIEVTSTLQIPSFHIVGLVSQEIGESRERIRAAIESSGLEFPKRRIVVNLSPASVRKSGTGLDLPVALSILQSEGDFSFVASGELGLTGKIKPVGQAVRALFAAWSKKIPALFLAPEDFKKAQQAIPLLQKCQNLAGSPPQIYAVQSLLDAYSILQEWQHTQSLPTPKLIPFTIESPNCSYPAKALLSISPHLERTLGVAAAGQHHLLLLGPKGIGKSYALEWLQVLQPKPSTEIQLHQILLAELTEERTQNEGSPFVSPIRKMNSYVKPAALLGSVRGNSVYPGEFSLAHGGLLLADEFPEWSRDSREALRQPLEEGRVTLSRVKKNIHLPAQFTLAATGNLCPCGGWPPELTPPSTKIESFPSCRCTLHAKQTYFSRLSGPILDRIDIVLMGLSPNKDKGNETPPKIKTLQERVEKTYFLLQKKYNKSPGSLSGAELEEVYQAYPALLKSRCFNEQMSLRSRHKILKLALTLAAWDCDSMPSEAHLLEAYFYRSDRIFKDTPY